MIYCCSDISKLSLLFPEKCDFYYCINYDKISYGLGRVITDLEKVTTKLVNANVKQNIYSNEKEKNNLINQYHKQLIMIDTEINEHKNKIIEHKNKIEELENKKNRIATKVSIIAANDLDEKISRSESLLELYEK